jgi:Brp/Blh family beta-carotene 15,15'-monooxygenase
MLAVSVVMWVGEMSTVAVLMPLGVSVVLFGLPHGAVDHLVPARMSSFDVWQSVAWVVAIYTVVGGAYLWAWWQWPTASFVVFVAMTWMHWGQGDVHALVRLQGSQHLARVWQRVLAGFVRGGLPMWVPFVAFPDDVREVAGLLVGHFSSLSTMLSVLFDWRVQLGVTAMMILAATAYLAAGVWKTGWSRGWWLDVAELGVLTVYFWYVPPLAAIGLYFCVWHGYRHMVRLSLQERGAREAWQRGAIGVVWYRFARDAAPLTLLSLVLFGALAWAVPRSPESMGDWAGLYLVFISVLTMPHVMIVCWMDGVEGVWRRDGAVERSQ